MEQDAKIKSLPRGPGAAEGTEAPRAHWSGSRLPRGSTHSSFRVTGTGMDSGS